jgi:hypothetical protein
MAIGEFPVRFGHPVWQVAGTEQADFEYFPRIELNAAENFLDWAITYAGEYTQDGATCLRRVGIILSEPKEALPPHARRGAE